MHIGPESPPITYQEHRNLLRNFRTRSKSLSNLEKAVEEGDNSEEDSGLSGARTRRGSGGGGEGERSAHLRVTALSAGRFVRGPAHRAAAQPIVGVRSGDGERRRTRRRWRRWAAARELGAGVQRLGRAVLHRVSVCHA